MEPFSTFAAACTEKLFFVLPTWYHYLNTSGKMAEVDGHCEFVQGFSLPGDLALVGLGILDILLRLSGLVAVGFVMYGGIKFITSQGDPEGAKQARQTITNALIGLVIALMATTIVAFVGSKVL